MKKSSKIALSIKAFTINYLDSMLKLLGIRCEYKHHPRDIEDMLDGFQHFYRIGGTTAIQLINQNKGGIIQATLVIQLVQVSRNSCLNPLSYLFFKILDRFITFLVITTERINQLICIFALQRKITIFQSSFFNG